jgi:hypothetical protein
MATKEGEAAAKEFTVSLPDDTEALVFSVTGTPVPPCQGGRTVLWVRAREPGGDWGQSAWVEVARGDGLAKHYVFRSKPVTPGTLWMAPEKFYTIEVTPEGILYPDIKVECVRRSPPVAESPAAASGRGSALDSPLLWVFAFLAMFTALLAKILK